MRRLAAPLFAGFLLMALAACATPAPGDAAALAAGPRTAWIVGRSGAAIGQATFTEAPFGVLIRLEFSERALSPGWHGLHLHQRGDCSDFADGFRASGGHVGMGRRIAHGLRNAAGPEAGDLPNIFAAPSGPFGAEIYTSAVTLAPVVVAGRAPLLDADGAALLIHAQADDHETQPIGGAGERVACAALTQLP